MMGLSLPEIARAVRGKVVGRYVLAAGPGHSRRDASLLIELSDTLPGGFRVHSFANDEWRGCRDYVNDALGRPRDDWQNYKQAEPEEIRRRQDARRGAEEAERAEELRRQRFVLRIWEASRELHGTPTEQHLNFRGLELPDGVGDLRHHPRCPFGEEAVPAMVAAIRCLRTRAIVGVHRTALTAAGRKVGRKVYGSVRAAAIMFDPAATVADAIVVGEGVETALTARQIGVGPAWSLVSTGNIAVFPVIDGVQSLTVLAEIDKAPNKPSATAYARVAERWHAAGRRVDRLWPPIGCNDLNDAIRRDTR